MKIETALEELLEVVAVHNKYPNQRIALVPDELDALAVLFAAVDIAKHEGRL